MAKVDPASLFTEVRGTVGGLTFSKNRSGFFVQRINRPIASTRPAPRARRSAFAAAAKFWQEHRNDVYEDPNKGDIPVSEWWDDFAGEPGNEKLDVFGGTYQPSGYNWFLTYAILQEMEGEDPLTLPPSDPAPALWPYFAVTYRATPGVNNSFFISNSTSTAEGSRPWISARIQYNQFAGPVVAPFFFLDTFSYSPASSAHFFQTELESVFGAIPANSRAYFSVRFRIPNGRMSSPETFSLLPGESHTYTSP